MFPAPQTEACAPLVWVTLNLLIYWKQYALLMTRPMTRVWAKLTTNLNKILCS